MAYLFGYHVDHLGNEIQNVVLQNLSVAPTSPKVGQIFYNTALSKFGYWNGTSWIYGATLSFANVGPISWTVANDVVTLSLAAVTQTVNGLMLASDKVLLDNATPTNIVSTIIRRDGSGNFACNVITAAKVTGTGAPTNATDLCNKAYVDAIAQGLTVKSSVRVATTGTISLTGLQSVDGVTLVANDRVLVKNQATANQNGIWLASATAWTRALDYPVGLAAKSTFMFIEEGTSQAEGGWICTNDNGSDIVGTASLTYSQFSGAGQIVAGFGMTKTGNILDVVAADASIVVAADSIRVGVDNITLEVISSVGIRVKANSITASHIANAALGTGLSGGNGTPLFVVNYTPVIGTTVTRTIGFTGNIGGGTATIFTHNLNSLDVQTWIRDAATNDEIKCDTKPASVNTISVTANGASRSVRVVVQG